MTTMSATQVTQATHDTLASAATAVASATSAAGRPAQKPSAQRTSLMHMLHDFKTELLWVAIFSFIANLLTLTPTLYMLQVFDRVMQSQNEFTLIALTVILVMFLLVMALYGTRDEVLSRLDAPRSITPEQRQLENEAEQQAQQQAQLNATVASHRAANPVLAGAA